MADARHLAPKRFPLLRAAARNPDLFDRCLETLAGAVEAQSIRNVELQELKANLGPVVEAAWHRQVSEPFLYNGAYQRLPKEVHEFTWKFQIMGLYSVPAAHKRALGTKLAHPVIDAMRKVLCEALPLAQAVDGLKDHVVKGRTPRPPAAAPENPDKIVKTCPCCFRPIAVIEEREHMAHHGYQRPGDGRQTPSCEGIRFPPLELSTAGLDWMIEQTGSQLAAMKAEHAGRDSATSLAVLRQRKHVTVTRDDPDWAREFHRYVMELESSIAFARRQLDRLQERRRAWKPQPY